MNAQFELDPGRVYSGFSRVIDDHSEVAKPKYVHRQEDNESQRNVFSNAEEATTFWRTLWDAQGAGNVKAEWLDEVRDAIREKVPVPPEKDFELSAKQAEKVIMKKRNWSAPGPDRIVNFLWKKQKDARRMNAQFELDPGRVYSDFRRVIDDHSEVAKPKYVHGQEDNESQRLSLIHI